MNEPEPTHSATLDEPAPRGRLELGVAAGGGLRWLVVDLTAVVEPVRERLDLSPVAAAALGRTLAGAALLLGLASKTPHRLLLEIRGDGPLGSVLAEIDGQGTLRGAVDHPRADVPHRPDGKLDVAAAVGKGTLQVLREIEGGRYHSQVELVSGEIAEDLAHYLLQSEQIRSAVLLGVLGDPRGVRSAGGMLVEVMPDAREESVARLEANLGAIQGVSHLLAAGGVDHVLHTVLAGLAPEVREGMDLTYRCRCSREGILERLRVIAAQEGEPLVGDNGLIETECGFCGTQYHFQPAEVGLTGSPPTN